MCDERPDVCPLACGVNVAVDDVRLVDVRLVEVRDATPYGVDLQTPVPPGGPGNPGGPLLDAPPPPRPDHDTLSRGCQRPRGRRTRP
jgi:hypothetical protein